MKIAAFYTFFLLIFFTGVSQKWASAQAQEPATSRNLIVITDMEPGDRIALELISARLSHRVLMIGTTVKNSYRKAALVRNQLAETNLANVPVYVGAGGQENDYTDIASSKAAREYHHEGQGILRDGELEYFKQIEHLKGSQELGKAIRSTLQQSLKTNSLVEIMLLAPPTDLIAVLDSEPALRRAIGHIHVMGGWVDAKNPVSDIIEKRTTYNINMDERASAALMQMTDIPMTLYSSHIIKPNFAGGSVNRSNFPEIIDLIEGAQASSLQVFRKAGLSWDTHLIEKIPPLKNVIGENAGRQFTPADPLVVVGLLNSKLVTSSEPVNISIDLKDLDASRGYRVDVSANPDSKIRLVTGIDTRVFGDEMILSLKNIEQQNSIRRSTLPRFGAVSCKNIFL